MANLVRTEFTCPFCGKDKVTFIDPDRYELWKNGAYIQEAFDQRYFDATYREIIKTNLCSECQAAVFRDPDAPMDEQEEIVYWDAEPNTKAEEELERKLTEIYDNADRE